MTTLAIRDSVGIIIVENLVDTASLPILRADTVPSLRIGTVAGDRAYEFDIVRRALRMRDGRIVVGDDNARALRVFSEAGEYERTVGRVGGGPGEFQVLYDVGRFDADSIFVWDSRLRRATVVSTAGEVVLFIRPRDAPPGSMVFTERPPAAGHRSHIRLAYDRFYIAESAEFGIDVHRATGGMLRRIRFPRLDRAYTDAALHRQRAIEEAGDNESGRYAAETLHDPAWWPEMRPAYSSLEIDRDGNIWVREWQGDPDRPYRWLVLDLDGRARVVIELPRDLRVLDYALDAVLALETDSLDVPYVTVRPLIPVGAR